MKKLNIPKKKLLIAAVALVLVAAVGVGIWAVAANSGSDPVFVYEFSYLGMTEYWGDSQESYGPVSTDRIQTIYLSDTQIVTEILVSQGDTVKKGDVLMRFDTTLSDLALERKRLDVEKLKLQLQDAKEDLWEINAMKPMVIPQNTGNDSDVDSDKGDALSGNYKISTNKDYDGSSQEKALICWLNSAATVDDDLLEALRQKAIEYQTYNAQKKDRKASSASAMPASEETTQPSNPSGETTQPANPSEETTQPTDPSGETTQPTDPSEETTQPTDPSEETTQPTDPSEETTQPTDPSEEPTQPTEPEVKPVDVERFYVVIKVTEGNTSLGSRVTWQGMQVIRDGSSDFRFRYFSAAGMQDHMLTEKENEDLEEPQIDFGSGYTAAQIAEMRTEQQKKIKELEFNIKMAETEYKIMQTEVSDGSVYATVDGEVVSVLSEEEAKLTMQPIVKVSGGGGFYVEGSVSELEKDKLLIGQEVTINDWNTGMTYTGTVESIGDFPSSDSYFNGLNNPNASYYPFTVFIDGSADLQAGRYVSIMYSAGSSENGIYLQNPFVRTEQGRSYVYVQGGDGRLEKRFVTTGKSLWGSYTEILSGLSETDLIAFPYGKNVKEGAPTQEGDLSDLYNY